MLVNMHMGVFSINICTFLYARIKNVQHQPGSQEQPFTNLDGLFGILLVLKHDEAESPAIHKA